MGRFTQASKHYIFKNPKFHENTIQTCTTFLVFLAGAFTAQAQVKIGANPTTINPNNNLEVEGSMTGRKFSIDKTTSKVTIADGTQGNGKVLTSNVNGGASWQTPFPVVGRSKITGGVQPLPQGFTTANFTTIEFDQLGGANLAEDKFVIPANGYYTYTITQFVDFPPNAPNDLTWRVGNWGIDVRKNGASLVEYILSPTSYNGMRNTFQYSNTAYFVAGDYLQIVSNPCYNCSAGNDGYQIASTSLIIDNC